MAYKKRLVLTRQGFVFVGFVTPNMLCVTYVDNGDRNGRRGIRFGPIESRSAPQIATRSAP